MKAKQDRRKSGGAWLSTKAGACPRRQRDAIVYRWMNDLPLNMCLGVFEGSTSVQVARTGLVWLVTGVLDMTINFTNNGSFAGME